MAHEYVAWRCWQAANGDGTVLYVFRGEVGGGMMILGREMAFAGRGSSIRKVHGARSR
jgi:hypothetical protein